tara:strand:+ start:28 stop:618 length:591 start_codon:yes stop_codon:yes gene_type:complete
MAFKMKGSPMYRNFGIGKPSPNKQATISSVSDSLQNKPNPAIEKLIKELEETQDSTNNANQAELERRAKQIQQNVSPKEFNKQIEEHNEKNSPNKQFEEGDYYDTRSKKSPNKQRDLGGTKSGKGNIFTKRGRTQRKLNKYQDEQNKLRSEHIDKNKKATKLAVKAHEEKMVRKQLKNRPKTVVMKGDKDVTDQYR